MEFLVHNEHHVFIASSSINFIIQIPNFTIRSNIIITQTQSYLRICPLIVNMHYVKVVVSNWRKLIKLKPTSSWNPLTIIARQLFDEIPLWKVNTQLPISGFSLNSIHPLFWILIFNSNLWFFFLLLNFEYFCYYLVAVFFIFFVERWLEDEKSVAASSWFFIFYFLYEY